MSALKEEFKDAFHAWFHLNFANHIEEGAEYLLRCAHVGSKDSVVWDVLQRTGADEYSWDTFMKAAQLMLQEAKKAA